jgi:lysozyme
VRGVDVSSYQGIIDWKILSKQDIQFAFIKATEGSCYIDEYFTYNYEQAMKTDLRIGAYHFFSYDSRGSTQADNFIATVPKSKNMLPPVVDIEFYGDKEKHLPNKVDVTYNLTTMLEMLEKFYGVKPIIYATQKSYKLYISGSYTEYDIWIRNVFFKPSLPDEREWTFWQYSDKEKLKGYNGSEKFIDMNVFKGSQQEFDEYSCISFIK